ncbi:hypothetical protein BDV96DRAFT_503782 [Lophiotrema nucula]|uniref:Zn(2)-C6 fungal-type domain-containing protein n=1 Tax=Lophiotrema nucula TaxID=690887 RepID=A0A6A5YRQ7_9PLEO|nr:hypothetical protein BDV96DRAFT_503782 [Lophiotrema nucula]
MPERVPKRRAHTKSRKGCIQCKQRHTKCDEVHPQCTNCVRLEIQCSWPDRKNGLSPQAQSPHPETHVIMAQGSRSFTRINSPAAAVSVLGLDDMRLLHHWTTKTCKSMDLGAMSSIWQEDFIEIGFEHPFLLHGFLAVAAIHKAVSAPQTDNSKLLLQADLHITNALRTYRQHLVNPTRESCVPMFIMATVLAMYNLGIAQLEEPEDSISAIHHCFRLIKGVQVVLQPHWDHVKQNQYFHLMANKAMSSRADALDTREVPEIMRLQELADGLEEQDQKACTQAIHELHKTYISIANCAETEDVYSVMFVWPSVVTDRYLDLLSSQNPIAAIILSYFAVLLAKSRQNWWFRDWPRRIIIASQRIVDKSPEFQEWMQLPMATLESQG